MGAPNTAPATAPHSHHGISPLPSEQGHFFKVQQLRNRIAGDHAECATQQSRPETARAKKRRRQIRCLASVLSPGSSRPAGPSSSNRLNSPFNAPSVVPSPTPSTSGKISAIMPTPKPPTAGRVPRRDRQPANLGLNHRHQPQESDGNQSRSHAHHGERGKLKIRGGVVGDHKRRELSIDGPRRDRGNQRRHDDRCKSRQRVMANHHFQCKKHPGQWRIERSRNRTGDATGQQRAGMLARQARPAGELCADGGTEVHNRPFPARRSAKPQGGRIGQRPANTLVEGHVCAMQGAVLHHLGHAYRSATWHKLVNEIANDQTTTAGANRRCHQGKLAVNSINSSLVV